MPRNAAGVYALPNVPVISDTTILAAEENSTRDDIAVELTNSLDRNGRGGMVGAFRIADGSAAAPGVAFVSDTNCGLWRESADTWHLVAGGVGIQQVSGAGIRVFTTAAGDQIRWTNGGATPKTGYLSSGPNFVAFSDASLATGNGVLLNTTGVSVDLNVAGVIGSVVMRVANAAVEVMGGRALRVNSGLYFPPTTGIGLELFYDNSSGYGGILAYDRSTPVYKSLQLMGANVQLNVSGTVRLLANATGVQITGTLDVSGIAVANQSRAVVFKVISATSFVLPAAGEGLLHTSTVNGVCLYGNGTGSDITLLNKALGVVMSVATGTLIASFGGQVNVLGTLLSVGATGNTGTIWMNRSSDGAVSHSLTVSSGSLVVNDTLSGNGVKLTWGGAARVSAESVVVLTGNSAGAAMMTISHTASNPYGFYISFSAAAPNNGTNFFMWASDTVQARFIVYSNGGITNFSAFNAALSDARLKTFSGKAIPSQRAKLRKLDIVMGRYRDSTEPGEFPMLTAQQVQKVLPECVTQWAEGKLGIFEQRLWIRHLKVTQEHDDVIETLASRVKEIERRLDA